MLFSLLADIIFHLHPIHLAQEGSNASEIETLILLVARATSNLEGRHTAGLSTPPSTSSSLLSLEFPSASQSSSLCRPRMLVFPKAGWNV